VDREKLSAIAHRSHDYCNPFARERLERIIELLRLSPDDRAVDFGCGKAELPIRLIERFGVTVVAIDRSARMIAEARRRAHGRIVEDRLILHEADGSSFGGPARYALGVCVGATHVFGGFRNTLRHLMHIVHTGGNVLVGEAYWKRKPDRAYVEALKTNADEYVAHHENVAQAEALGLVPLHAAVSSEEDWDDYEWRYSRSVEQYAMENPHDADVPAMLEHIRAWRKAYLRWGRDTLGFGLYLFHRP
jgi:cyclopropane fatty-acyl-phospholipid synthase-like methyltransferase